MPTSQTLIWATAGASDAEDVEVEELAGKFSRGVIGAEYRLPCRSSRAPCGS
jgi:hypothetical protein